MQPTPQQVKVATDAVRQEATVWEQQAAQLQAAATTVAGLRVTRLEAGIFQLVVEAYNDLVATVTDRCREGHDRMADIGSTLRRVADVYETEDAANAHRLKNLY
jgi:hypothetical protein